MPEKRRARALAVGLTLTLLVSVFSVDYTVKRGDTLRKIASDHGVSLSELVAANDVKNPDLIFPGQVLTIPGKGGEPDVVHVVVRGDTLNRIAARYGTSLASLVKANSIRNPDLIRIGQNVVIPGAAPSAGSGSGGGGSSGSAPQPSVGGVARSGAFHVVRPGESLSSIASAYEGVSANQIAKANGIIDGTIFFGTRLFLDGPEFVARGSEGETTYTVRPGDRLFEIASAHGTSVSTLVSRNKISDPNVIRAGQQLVIPSGQSWVCPVTGSTFFNDWGFPRGANRYHEGNDLFAPHGTPVHAPVSGMIEQKVGSIGGNQFNLRGDDGVVYIGSHLSKFGKSGRVKAGDVVGYVGNTGNAQGTRPHLHFGMYIDGVVVNPYPTLITQGCK